MVGIPVCPPRFPLPWPTATAVCEGLSLQMIDSRGVRVWPAGVAEASSTDSFRCRFLAEGPTDMDRLIALLKRISESGMEIAMTETLRSGAGSIGVEHGA